MNAHSVADPARPLLGTGEVRHERLRPTAHRFAYPTYFLMLPLRSLAQSASAALRRNRFGLISFHDRDHGDGLGDVARVVGGTVVDADLDRMVTAPTGVFAGKVPALTAACTAASNPAAIAQQHVEQRLAVIRPRRQRECSFPARDRGEPLQRKR